MSQCRNHLGTTSAGLSDTKKPATPECVPGSADPASRHTDNHDTAIVFPATSVQTGSEGEDTAAKFLTARGYRIIERNYRGERFEIDIIAEHEDTIVFCEVKTARSRSFGPSTSWVTPAKARRIARAAMDWIAERAITNRTFRFDVIGIMIVHGEPLIEHIRNAFAAPEDL